jgi:hypothetical protein
MGRRVRAGGLMGRRVNEMAWRRVHRSHYL